jgi:4-hydroxybenzoate-CoA ligase
MSSPPMLDDQLQRRPYNAAAEFIDTNLGRGLSDKIAFQEPERSLTYATLRAQSFRFGAALRGLGVRPEERIALAIPDTIDFPIAFWGAVRAGIVAVPLNTLLPAEQYGSILADSRAAALVATLPVADAILPLLDRLPALRALVLLGTKAHDRDRFRSRDVHLFDELVAQAAPAPVTAPTNSDEVAFWMYTSGSTGEPKAVKHVHMAPMATARLMGQGIIGIRQDDVVFSASKLFFSYGFGNALTFPMSVGASSALLPQRPTPEAVFALMRRYRPTIFYAVPSLYAMLLAHREMSRGAGSDRLRLCVSAGEVLPARLGERWRDATGVDVLDGIGSTEMLQTFISNRPGDIRYGSSGKPVPGYEARIVDEHGREVRDGEIGELMVRGPSAGEGYWNRRTSSRRTFAGEWVHTGDKYRRDPDGYYFHCGRTDDMFKVSGMWVSPIEVEAALVSHEAVLEAAVIGKEDADGLIKPKAFVVLRNGHVADPRLLEALRVHVKEHAGLWKYPRWIDVRPELPRTATGKIQRFKLRDMEAQSLLP